MLAGPIVYPGTEAVPVLQGYAEFTATMPDELSVLVSIGSGPDGQPSLLFLPLWNGDKRRGERIMSDLQAFGTPQLAQVGPMTYGDILALVDAPVDASEGCHWETRTRSLPALTHDAIECDYESNRRQDVALFDGQLAPFPRRRDPYSCGGERLRLAPGTFNGGDHRRLDARRE